MLKIFVCLIQIHPLKVIKDRIFNNQAEKHQLNINVS